VEELAGRGGATAPVQDACSGRDAARCWFGTATPEPVPGATAVRPSSRAREVWRARIKSCLYPRYRCSVRGIASGSSASSD
jgi:hypothetical protein